MLPLSRMYLYDDGIRTRNLNRILDMDFFFVAITIYILPIHLYNILAWIRIFLLTGSMEMHLYV